MVETWVSQSPPTWVYWNKAQLCPYSLQPKCPGDFLLSCGEPSSAMVSGMFRSSIPLTLAVPLDFSWPCGRVQPHVLWGRVSCFCLWSQVESPPGHYWIGPKLYSLVSFQGHTRLRSLAMLFHEVESLPLLHLGRSLSICLKAEALCRGTTRLVVEMAPLFHSVPTNVIPNCYLSLICCSVFGQEACAVFHSFLIPRVQLFSA